MEVDYTAIGKRVKQLRKERNMSQEQLAEQVGVSVPHMSNIETGKTKFSLPVLIGLANVLGVMPDVLLFDQVNPEGKVRGMVLKEIASQLTDCTEVQMLMLEEVFCSAKKILVQYDRQLKGMQED
ncbi:MAG: helix-turn-helix domain-containing protein [Lachnospiraceae bacterium]|nr:helix-turn-helix domain-containing protein [Lachnospiraceae bacterium]